MDQKPQDTQPNSESSNQIDHVGHVLVVSYPLQGHVAPLIKLANKICQFGVKVTFLTTDFTLAKMASSMPKSEQEGNRITFASVPDGLEPDDDRKDQKKLAASIHKVMPGHVEDFIRKTNDSGYKVTGFIVDSPLTPMLEVPKMLGIKCATYWCSTSGCLALGLNLQKLIESKVIDANDGKHTCTTTISYTRLAYNSTQYALQASYNFFFNFFNFIFNIFKNQTKFISC